MNLYNYDEILDITNIVLCPSYCKIMEQNLDVTKSRYGKQNLASPLLAHR